MDRGFLQFCGLSLTTLQAIASMQFFEEGQGVPMFPSSHTYGWLFICKVENELKGQDI